MTTIEFKAWPKTPRLFRDMIITEKIDGTNAAVQILHISDLPHWIIDPPVLFDGDARYITTIVDNEHILVAQSRKRIITPEYDNFGFARWVQENATGLVEVLGKGTHFGEWWGNGIQRGYGLPNGDKRFSLFNVSTHADKDLSVVPGLDIVPVLCRYTFDTYVVEIVKENLRNNGSVAAPGFMKPEGVVVFHTASGKVYKSLLENDQNPKGE